MPQMPLPTTLTVAAWWNDYVKRTLPDDIGEKELLEQKGAFYAGAMAMSNILFQVAAGTNSNDIGITRFENLVEEIRQVGVELLQKGI